MKLDSLLTLRLCIFDTVDIRVFYIEIWAVYHQTIKNYQIYVIKSFIIFHENEVDGIS